MSDVIDLTIDLIRRRSLTPDDAGCQALIAQRLQHAGFAIEHMPHGEVSNLWAVHGTQGPLLCLLGHTDVVPTGPREDWSCDPFEPEIRDGLLYGRGAADMKGSVAAMVCALERLALEQPDHAGRIALLLTSDEEGVALDGVRQVAARFRSQGRRIDWCLVGEPSSARELGDAVRIGRRGSLTGTLTVRGRQGHVAYPDKADNPLHRFAPALAELATRQWDTGSADFPPTSFQVSNLNSGTGADNVIPGALHAIFNFRYNPQWSASALRGEVEDLLQRHDLQYELQWRHSGEPFLTQPGALRAAVRAALREHCGIAPDESTLGGTSDGRFIAPLGAEVVELGPINASIHQVDEHVRVQDLLRLVDIYLDIARRLLAGAEGTPSPPQPSP